MNKFKFSNDEYISMKCGKKAKLKKEKNKERKKERKKE